MPKLPTEKSVIERDLSKYTTFIYGREKIGKTSLAAQFPDAVFLMFEPGGKSLEIYRTDINNWLEFIDVIIQLASTNRFKTVVIDTVDIALKYCSDYICKKLAITHPSDEEWGKGWGLVRDEFSKQLSTICKLNRGVVFISHAAGRDVKRMKGEGYMVEPTLQKQGRAILEPMVDIWGYYGYDGTQRFLQIKGDEEVNAGCRLTENFVGVNKISMGTSPKQAYDNFITAFNTTQKGGSSLSSKKLVVRRA